MSKKAVAEDANATLDALINQINKKYKHRVIARAEDVPNVFFLRRPSGIMQLDIDTGGGLPAGGWCMLSGPEGGGKSTLLYKYFAYHQRLYKQNARVALAVSEFLPDYFYMRQCGVQIAIPDSMIEERNAWRVARGMPHFTRQEIREFKSQVGRFDVMRGSTGEEVLEATLAAFGTRLYGIIGLDSISAILPAVDADKDLDDPLARAAAANLQTKFSKQFHPLTLGLDENANETTLITIAQVRANNKKAEAPSHIQKYLPDWAATGSYAMRHGKLVDVCIWSGAKVKEGTGDTRHQTGKVLNWEIIKGKAGTHDGIRGEVDFYYANNTDDPEEIFLTGLKNAVIVEGRAGFDVVRESGDKLLQSFSKKGLLDKLKDEFDFQLAVRMEILAARGIACRYR